MCSVNKIGMQFHYIASQQNGKILESDIDAENVGEVLSHLAAKNLKPVSVRPVSKMRGRHRLFGGKITIADKIFLSKYLALMLKIGTGLLQAVNILIEDFDKPVIRNLLLEVKANLEKGLPFFSTFAKYPRSFGQVYINLIKAGEASGSLESVFDNLTNSLAKEKNLKDQVRGALIYPVLLLVAALFILVFLVFFALPKISKVFSEAGFNPPLFSKVVFGIGAFFGQFGIILIILLIVSIIAFFYLYRTSNFFRKLVFGIISDIPVVKEIIRKMALQRFSATLSSLIKAGLPLTSAIEITADAVGNIELKDALLRISREGLAKGLTVGDAFKREPFFPRTVANLIAISEKAGHIEEILETLANFYVSEIDSSMKSLVSVIEPVLLLFLGLIIGVIALAIIIPIYQLTTSF